MGGVWWLLLGLGRDPFHHVPSLISGITVISYCGLSVIESSFVLILKIEYEELRYTQTTLEDDGDNVLCPVI